MTCSSRSRRARQPLTVILERDGAYAFVADPVGVAARAGLSPDQCRAVEAMPLQDLRTTARGYDWIRRMLGR